MSDTEPKKPERHPFFESFQADVKDHVRIGTGRTTAMIEQMKDGDMLVVHSAKFGQQLMKYARDKFGKTIVVIAAADRKDFFHKVQMDMRQFNSNIFVDHHFLDIFMADIIREQEQMFMSLQKKYVR